MSNALAVVILAAGKGTRMNSSKPKVLHELAGLPLISHVLLSVKALRPKETVVVLSHEQEEVKCSQEFPKNQLDVSDGHGDEQFQTACLLFFADEPHRESS